MTNATEPMDISKVYMKSIYWGMALNLFIPAVLVAVGLFLKSKGIPASPIKNLESLMIILLVISISEVAIIYFLKKSLVASIASQKTLPQGTSLEQIFVRYSIIIFSMALAPSVYGFVYLLLGGTMDWFLVFVAITLLCFMLFKPRANEIKKLFDRPSV
jgi:hypothetical protein